MSMSSRRLGAPSLLATTSLAALLLGAPARAGGLSFDGQTQASVTNPANTTVTSIVINNSTVTGAVTNAGTISPGKAGVGNGVTAALAVTSNSTIGGGIHNSGTITATGSGFSVFGTLQVTPTQAPSINAGTIALAGTLNLAPQGNLFAFGASRTYRDVFVGTNSLSGSFASVTTTAGSLFQASLSPDATTPNALDATLALSQTGLAASAQDLTQSERLGLDAPRVLTQAVQDRLIANGGALGEGAPPAGAASAGGASPLTLGHANPWVRGFDQFGSASGTGAAPGYDVNRAAPLIGGVDWSLDNGIVAGIAATYVATSASFKDGSRTNVSSYQGAAYAGWAVGPWYASGSAVVSFNDFGTSRLLTPFGLPGLATSSPSGQSYEGHAEAGYRWVLPAAGTNVSVTPYAAVDYVNAHLSGFSETGGFGALSVNAADSSSFQTTLGVRLTSRIAIGSYGTLIPELRLGWNHEFLDTAQSLSASLFGVAGSSFSVTGIGFGRDAALLGAGFSMELAPDAKVFVDYDGRLASHVQEHSISGGLRIRF